MFIRNLSKAAITLLRECLKIVTLTIILPMFVFSEILKITLEDAHYFPKSLPGKIYKYIVCFAITSFFFPWLFLSTALQFDYSNFEN